MSAETLGYIPFKEVEKGIFIRLLEKTQMEFELAVNTVRNEPQISQWYHDQFLGHQHDFYDADEVFEHCEQWYKDVYLGFVKIRQKIATDEPFYDYEIEVNTCFHNHLNQWQKLKTYMRYAPLTVDQATNPNVPNENLMKAYGKVAFGDTANEILDLLIIHIAPREVVYENVDGWDSDGTFLDFTSK